MRLKAILQPPPRSFAMDGLAARPLSRLPVHSLYILGHLIAPSSLAKETAESVFIDLLLLEFREGHS